MDNLHGSESTWATKHIDIIELLQKTRKSRNDLGSFLTFLRNGESTPRYLDTMYRHKR